MKHAAFATAVVTAGLLAVACDPGEVVGCNPNSALCDGGSVGPDDAPSERTLEAAEQDDAARNDAPPTSEDGSGIDVIDGGETDPVCGCGQGFKRCERPGTSSRFYCAPQDFAHSCGHPTECGPCVVKHARADCTNGICSVGACLDGWGDCNHDSRDGCEADLTTPANCGSCGHACQLGEKCQAGTCVSTCLLTQTDCDGACVDLANSAQHCGSCNVACDWTCGGGSCGPLKDCPTGQTLCEGTCVDTLTDPSHCGACSKVCPESLTFQKSSCFNGQCAPCPAGLAACGTRCVNTRSDRESCGGCGQPCDKACLDGRCDDLSKAALVSGVHPDDMAIDGQWVYYVDSQAGTVSRVDKSGGTPVPLASGQSKPWRLAVDEQFVYFTNALGAVMRVSKAGGDAAPLAMGNEPRGIAIDVNSIYFANSGTRSIVTVSKQGGAPATVVTLDASPAELLLDNSRLFFLTNKRASDQLAGWHLAWTAVSGGDVHWIAGDVEVGCIGCCDRPPNFAVNGNSVYWPCSANLDMILSRSSTSATGGRGAELFRFSNAGGAASVFLDGEDLYYTREYFEVRRFNLCTSVDVSALGSVATPGQMLTDASSLYVRTPSAIFRVPR